MPQKTISFIQFDMRVFIHPAVNPLYAGFYIQALEQRFGKKNIIFTIAPFHDLPNDCREVQMLFIVEDELGNQTRYAIDANDFHSVKPGVYEWSDVYGHCNANYAETADVYKEKLISLCPSFGVRIRPPFQLACMALRNALLARPDRLKPFMGKYKRSYTTCSPIEDYIHVEASPNYVFFCSTLWYSDEWNKNDETLNLTRARFIRACRDMKELDFEGGLVPQERNRSSEDLFKDCLYHPVSKKEWIAKTQQSMVVFNTPAFWGCHGWKLGEYLALGKCIISTRLVNDLPHPLEHGKNIHFVENSEKAMIEALQYIIAHPEYRKHLEQGALSYWKQYGSQDATLALLGLK